MNTPRNKNHQKSSDLSNQISDFLDKSKADDIVTIDLNTKSSIADFMLIASGTSDRHIRSMAEKLKEFLHKKGISRIHLEGTSTCDWVLIDAGDIIIHLFRPEIREFYALEKMWKVDFKEPSQSTENTA